MDSFLEACEATGPIVLELDGDDEPEDVRSVFAQPFVLIGRDPRADLILNQWEISRRHTYLQMIGGRLFWADLGSRTGSRQGEESAPSGWLTHHLPLRIGPYTVRLVGGAAHGEMNCDPEGPEVAFSQSARQLPEVILEFANARSSTASRRLDGPLALVGSGPECRPRLNHASVSRFHCAFLRTPDGVWVVDLLGRDGVSVNGRQVRACRLENRDEVQIGAFMASIRLVVPGDRERRSHRREGAGALARHSGSAPGETPGVLPDWGSSTPVPTGRLAPPAGERVAEPARRSELCAPPALVEDANRAIACDPLVTQLLSQFSAMQTQMFDQFHQTMCMMVQMFGNLQREQTEQVQAEMAELRRVIDEVQVLQAHMVGEPGDARRQAEASRIGRKAPARSIVGTPRLSVVAPEIDETPDSSDSRRDRSDHGAAVRASVTPASVPPLDLDSRCEEDVRETSAAVSAVAKNARIAPSTAPGPKAERADQSHSEDLHWLLTRRIAELQHERQSRWQRLISMVTSGVRG